MKLLITGSTGYIGSRLAGLARARGHEVFTTSRLQKEIRRTASMPWVEFDLCSNEPTKLPSDIEAIVHLAANTNQDRRLSAEQEIFSAKKLIESANLIGAKFIFVSSQTASPDAPTTYGKTKWRIEKDVLAANGWVVRPGQVYGSVTRGLFGTLVKTVKRLALLPSFLPAPRVQPIHVDDLADGLLRVVQLVDQKPCVFCLAAPDSVTFTSFLKIIARERLRCWRVFVPVPTSLLKAMPSWLLEKLGLQRLISLFDLPLMDSAADLNVIGLKLRSLSSGMHPSGNGNRRDLLQEGNCLLTYVLKTMPDSALLKRYVRTIEVLRNQRAIGIPRLFTCYPPSLSLLNDSSWNVKELDTEFQWRLNAATLLAEATIEGARRFGSMTKEADNIPSAKVATVISISLVIATEVFWRFSSIALSPIVNKILAQAK